MNAIDLFCGCGGLTRGLIDAGINVICGLDIWDVAIEGIIRRKKELAKRNCGFGAKLINIDKPCYTISARYWKDGYDALLNEDDTSGKSEITINSHIRRLTISELKRIQSFPDDYYLAGSKKDIIIQIGNSVPPLLAKAIGKAIKNNYQKLNCSK